MIEVVAAILEKDDKVLIARRKPGKHLDGYWEFPGGKIETNETAIDCLKREIKEEFSVEIEVHQYIGESIFEYTEKKIKLMAFSGKIIKGEIELRDHDLVEWIDLKDISLYKMAPADIPLIEIYKNKRNNK